MTYLLLVTLVCCLACVTSEETFVTYRSSTFGHNTEVSSHGQAKEIFVSKSSNAGSTTILQRKRASIMSSTAPNAAFACRLIWGQKIALSAFSSPTNKLFIPIKSKRPWPTVNKKPFQTHVDNYSFRCLRSQSDDNNEMAGKQNPGDAVGAELVSALARLDQKWQLARRAGGGKKIGEWTVLDVSSEKGDDSKPEIVYLLEPSSGSTPSCLIFFLGGAVLGQFPHIAYSSFIRRLSRKMNASVIAIPYEVGLDHFGIAQRAVNRMKNAVIQCEDSRGYPASLPKYAIGHSLGAKLHSIGIAATGIGEELSGVGFISYNNFGFAETIKMARSFAREMQVRGDKSGFGSGSPMPFDALIDLAEMAVSAVGLEFSPSPQDMDRIVRSKFDEELLKKTRLFVFDDDDLDSSPRFLGCFDDEDAEKPSVSNLPGTHLTVSNDLTTTSSMFL